MQHMSLKVAWLHADHMCISAEDVAPQGATVVLLSLIDLHTSIQDAGMGARAGKF